MSVLDSGSYTLEGRQFHVLAPPQKPARCPVLILLHSRNGTGAAILGHWRNAAARGSPLAALVNTHYIVAPDGPERKWNVVSESDRNDAHYVSVTLINHLATYANIIPTFSIVGSSNGSGLANRILIESDDPRIERVVTESMPQKRIKQNRTHYHNLVLCLIEDQPSICSLPNS